LTLNFFCKTPCHPALGICAKKFQSVKAISRNNNAETPQNRKISVKRCFFQYQ
jgi:hypothetical protein